MAAMANSGSSLSTVVTPCTQPDAVTPYQLTKVSTHKASSVTAADAPGTVAIQGMSGVR